MFKILVEVELWKELILQAGYLFKLIVYIWVNVLTPH